MDFWWRRHAPCAFLLWPLSLLYGLGLTIREWLYRKGIFKTGHLSIPTVVVGNILVGGAGKTPFVIAFAQYCQAEGLKPGIVSRGYGGRAPHYPYLVYKDSDPLFAGDEPVLIAKKTACPVVVDPNRLRAARVLENQCDLIISDDGLGHLALGRDIEIVLKDKKRGMGNGFLLPAGPLRQPLSRLTGVDYLIEKGGEGDFAMQIRHLPFYQLLAPHNLCTHFENKLIHAYAGIADPQAFFSALSLRGLHFIPHARPDHANYELNLFEGIEGIILLTEKDSVKCQKWADERFWVAPIEAVLSPVFLAQCIQSIKKLSRGS